ncbi:MAG: AMP-binding protein [Myxococcota bacterium]|nr:AMP-binding protein [Myxococcota bacterium]
MNSIPARMRRNGTDPMSKNKTGYSYKKGIEWIECSFEQYYQECMQVARSLIALGLQKEGKISILSFNRPEWIIADVGCMMAGGVPAGIYQTCSPQEVQYIIHHSESLVVFVENQEQWDKVNKQIEHLPLLQYIVTMKGCSIEDERTLTWEQFLSKGEAVAPAEVDKRIDEIEAQQPATFIYTSGTTGPPKAVMISHGNLVYTADQALPIVELNDDDCTLSYLPLSHIAEQVFSIHGPISAQSAVFFAESIEKLPQNLQEVCPSVFFGVPRIWEKFYAKLNAGLAEAPFVRKKIAAWAMDIGRKCAELRNRGESPTGLLKMQYNMANSLVFSKIKKKIGLSRAKVCVSGAAPISAEVLEFLSGLDIIIHEVYGQSEDCGPTTFNRPGNNKYGTVGTAFPGVDVKIADDDEILVRGKNVFLGYYKDEEATNKTLIDGWLHSGDLGKFDEDGFLTIIGRKKEIIITAGGKNIAPKNIEAALKDITLISQSVVIGDKRKFLSALLTLEPEATEKFASEKGIPLDQIHENRVLLDTLQTEIERVNEAFARVEHVRKFKVLPRDFSVDEGELTPTLKIKRRVINVNWADTIESMYAEQNP